MKVLITGGYGFIGSHVAERFNKEGHEVVIIDNLSTGKKENIQFKHRSYIVSVEDERCEEIFRSGKFDIVVHLAAQVSVPHSIENPAKDTETNVLGHVNMLNLSTKYKVKRFIYASSAAVYGYQEELPVTEGAVCEPISPYGISKLTGENYSQKWEKLYGLSTIGLRFANVYGPRQDTSHESGVISIFMSRLFQNLPISIQGDGKQTRDFLYVEDVADAIYRAANSTTTGIYNLSTNSSTSINTIVDILSEIHPFKEVIYTEQRKGDIQQSVLDNSKFMKAFDWSPIYSIRDGLSKTASYFVQLSSQTEVSATAAAEVKFTRRPQFTWIKRLLPTAENILAFLLTAWLTLTYANSAYGLIDVKLFYITIIGILYGNRQAILAVGLSIILFVYQKLLDGRDIISLTYDTDFFFQVAIYLFIGLVVGYSIDRKNAQIQQNEQKASELNDRYEFLDTVYNEVREVKDELQQRILNSEDSYGKIYSATKELESLEPELVFNAAVNVVKKIMNVPKVTIYFVSSNQSFLRLIASSGYDTETTAKSLRVTDHSYIEEMLQTGKPFINLNLDEKIPLMNAPIYHKDRIAAIISIDGLPFESFSLYHKNLFHITVDLIASALSKAFTHIEATETHRYVKDSVVLQSLIFEEILESKKLVYKQHQVPYLLLKCEANQMSVHEAAAYISTLLRETDYLGIRQDEQLYVLLSNTSKEDASNVLERLSHRSLIFSEVKEE